MVRGTAPMREFQLRDFVPDPLPRVTRSIKPHAPAAVFYTAQSLRAYTHSHAALLHAASTAGTLLGLAAGDRVLCTLPLDTVQGHTLGPLMGVLSGALFINASPRPDATAALVAAHTEQANVLVVCTLCPSSCVAFVPCLIMPHFIDHTRSRARDAGVAAAEEE